MKKERVKVKCHSGYIYPQGPESFIFQHEDYGVEDVEWQRREPGEIHFEIITRDRNFFELCYNYHKEEWTLVEASLKGGI